MNLVALQCLLLEDIHLQVDACSPGLLFKGQLYLEVDPSQTS